ncbi:MAG: hypothetical protein AB8B71_09710 [Paracoccaceae bacterium]
MTTIVTRLYADKVTAEQAVTALKLQNHPDGNIDMIASGKDAQAAMISASVPEDSAASYAKAMSSGAALVVCRAPVTPFGAARNAIATLDEFDSVDAGVENQNYYHTDQVHDDLLIDMKVDRTHRYWGTWKFELEEYGAGKKYPRSGREHWGSLFGTKPLDFAGKHWGSFLGHPLKGAGKYWGSFAGHPLKGAGTYWGSFLGHPLKGAGKYWGSFLGHPLKGAGKYWGTLAYDPILRSHPYMGSFFISPLGQYKSKG